MLLKYRILITLFVVSIFFLISPPSTSAATCTYQSTITGNHLDFSITSDIDKLAVIQYIRLSGSALVTQMFGPDVGIAWSYSDDPNCNISPNTPIGCRQIRGGPLGDGAFWQWYDWPTSQYHQVPAGIWGLDFNTPPTYESVGIQYGIVDQSQAWTYCTRTGDIPTPTATATTTATATATSTATATATATATTTATPTTTATSTSTPTPTPMGVPNLKQYEGGWENDVYDHTVKTIKDWGCALTSAVMVLKYHGHNTLPDTLNNWLNSQSDGYIRNGLINWLAVSRFSKINDSPTTPTLTYKRLGIDDEKLDNELENLRPAILKENGHFIVATGKNYNTYFINDPGYANRNTLESYGDSYLAINSYTPTHSDLSYMMFVINPEMELTLYDSNGNPVDFTSFIEGGILEGESVRILYFETPESGNYRLKVDGPSGDYDLDTYLYDLNGNVTQDSFSGILFGNDTDTYQINYSSQQNVDISIDEILKDLDNAYKNKLIKNKGIYQMIKIHLKFYQRFENPRMVKSLIAQVKMFTPRFIDPTYSLVLQQNLKSLIF
jgi:hypothetical protein